MIEMSGLGTWNGLEYISVLGMSNLPGRPLASGCSGIRTVTWLGIPSSRTVGKAQPGRTRVTTDPSSVFSILKLGLRGAVAGTRPAGPAFSLMVTLSGTVPTAFRVSILARSFIASLNGMA